MDALLLAVQLYLHGGGFAHRSNPATGKSSVVLGDFFDLWLTDCCPACLMGCQREILVGYKEAVRWLSEAGSLATR